MCVRERKRKGRLIQPSPFLSLSLLSPTTLIFSLHISVVLFIKLHLSENLQYETQYLHMIKLINIISWSIRAAESGIKERGEKNGGLVPAPDKNTWEREQGGGGGIKTHLFF